MVVVSVALLLLCLALGSALQAFSHVKKTISQRQNLTETNNVVYSLLIDLGQEDIFITSEDDKFKETKNLSIYQISKILNSYSEQIKIEELSEFNDLAKRYVESSYLKRRKITYRLQVEAKKILSKLRDKITVLTSEIEEEMQSIILTITLILSFSGIFMLFSIFYNFVERKSWNQLIKETTAAKSTAENLLNLKTQFLATVSHEVRTPLNGIIATAEVLDTNKSLDEDARSMCSIIQNSGNTLLRIINDILDYSKIESGNFDFNFDSFKIKNLVNEVVMANKHRALKKQIDLKITFKDLRFDSVITDRDRLAQVLYNVIGNAIKFTDHGSVNLIVEILDIDKKQFLSLKVKDTGIGIRDSECDKVFTPFIQIQSQGTSGEPGSGLGLSISKKIVERLKGELSFKSYYGIGTEFTIQIPIQKGKENTNEIFSQNNSSLQIWNKIDIQAAKDLAQAPKLIFIAEDNPTNQIVISTMLKNEDARHILFSNGKELLEALDTTLPRFILMDCQMPVMDGYEATQLVKQNFPNIPIIAMTADATEKNQDLCKSINFDGIMIKPLSIKAVNDLLVEYGLTTAKNDIRNLVTAKSSISVPLTGIPKSISRLRRKVW